MIHMIGNAHIDPVWLWRWQEGFQEVKATFRSALDRLNETDDFVFTAACAQYYRWVEENAPEMFEEIRARVREGRWKIVGGMWIQPDCNIPSGESFARQFLLSLRYFKEKFGVTVKTGYNVDSFGHSQSLPMLLRHAGMENYVFMRPGAHENAEIPAPLFRWFSPDGSSVRTFRIPDSYCSGFDSVWKDLETAFALTDQTGMPVMCFYGVGNHGGGPTIRNIASVQNYQKYFERGNEVVFSDPDAYFEAVKPFEASLPEWRREMQHHSSGCYSATSRIKMLNRKTESALTRCEKLGALSFFLTGHDPADLKRAWENLLFNQFHDILCGCAIRESYEDAENQLRESLSIAAREENAALQKISWRVDTVCGIPGRRRSKESHFALWELDGLGTPVVVFNPHPFEAEGPVQVYGSVKRVEDETGKKVPSQIVRASRTNGKDKWDCLFRAKVPALGYRLYWLYLAEDEQDKEAESRLRITENIIENRVIRASFDPETGALMSLVRKKSHCEVLSDIAVPCLVDIEHADTWAHAVFAFDHLREGFGQPEFQVLEKGPVRARLRITTRALSSELVQDYVLYADSDQLEVDVKLDMREKFRMLKLCFPVNVRKCVARAEVSYGVIARPCDGCEETGHRWMDMGDEERGLSVLNDGKYSFSASDGELRLTVANTSIYADHFGQLFRDEYCVHADMGTQEFRYALVPRDGSWADANLSRRGEVFNQSMPWVVETYHAGDLPVRCEGAVLDAENVSLGCLKRSEDGSGWVVRVNETQGREAKFELNLKLMNRKIDIRLAPWELKSLLIPDDPSQEAREVLFTEEAHD